MQAASDRVAQNAIEDVISRLECAYIILNMGRYYELYTENNRR